MSESFIHELPLKASPADLRILDVRFDQGRQLYNACLGEALRRLDLMRESKAWRRARQSRDKKERATLFRKLREEHGFSDYALQAFAIKTKNACAIGQHLDTHVCQRLATRAFHAAEQHAYGARGRHRFKGHNRLHSLEGKSNAAGIRFRDGRIEWRGLTLMALYDTKDKHGVEAHALACKTKYVRLVRRRIHDHDRWYAQLVQEGRPLWKAKNQVGEGVVGLDIGPSSIAAVSDADAFLAAFCAELDPIQAEIRLLQRTLDRSRRATNPDNYHPNGTVRPGPKVWKTSVRYRKVRAQITEANRRLAETRSRSHGRLANQVIALGQDIKTEKLSYRGFQKQYGRSVGHRAPGMFLEKLTRKAESAGGGVIEFPTRTTRLSQTCHCGAVEKKPLSQRWHECRCGVGPVQRDLYSAFLARFAEEETLDMRKANEAFPGAQPLLQRAMARVRHQAANGGFTPASFGIRRQSRSPVEDGSTSIEAAEAVRAETSVPESRGELGGAAVRTPCL